MEVSPVSAWLGAMGSLPRKFDELLATSDWALRGAVMDEIQHLKADLCILYKLMLKLSGAPQEPPMAARYWMKEVRELSYDMVDFADQFLHAHGRAKICRAARRKNKNISRLKIDRLPQRRKWRPWITDNISEFRARAREAIQRYRRYKFGDCSNSNPGCSRIGRELPTILPDAEDLVSIEGPTNELERWLISREKQLKVVSIVGVAGIGKTTLALKLWGKLRGQFECGAFVQTAQKPDMRGILRNILLQVRPHQPPNHGEMRHLINDLREYLQDKRYFVIIDDLWATSVWDVVSRAFPQSDCCSRIIITTEIMEVALACCCFFHEHIFKMEPLSDNDSEKLLLQRILVSRNQSPQQFDDVTPQILRSCGGLPLAIIIVARILASQPEKLEQWGSAQNSSDSIFMAKPTMEGFMRQILNICFISLPHYLKTCLLHLSTYPEGYLFLKDDLVKQWVAECFICANEGEDMNEVAGSYFDELVSMGLIQVMDIYCDYELLSYSVHQLVLDLITYKSIEENFITVVDYSQTTISLPDKVRRLALHFGSAAYASRPESTGLSQVRSLFFSGLFNCIPSFMVFKLLQVLILHFWDDTGTKRLNLTGICELPWLRYLQVTCNVIVKLPDKIETMKHLETLEINARGLDVPPDIVRLSSLLHLRLRGAKLPSGIGSMRFLQTLMHFDIGNSSEDNLWGLGELTNLRDLYLTYSSSLSSEHLKRNLIALASSLGKLCNLKSFTLVTGTAGMVVLFDGLSSMSTPIFLERLELLPPICIFARLPKWTGQLHKISIMKVAVRELPTSDIAILTGLPSLIVLSLFVQTAPEERIVFNDRAFPVLKCFKFRCGVLFMSFMAGAMPNLCGLNLGFNAHIGEEYGNMLVGIEHLLNLQDIVVQIGATTESEWRAAESAINYAINKHSMFPRRNLKWVDLVEEEGRPSEKHHWKQENVSLGEKHGVLDKANDMNKNADSGLSQLPNLLSTVASGSLKSGSSVEESKESAAPALPFKFHEYPGFYLQRRCTGAQSHRRKDVVKMNKEDYHEGLEDFNSELTTYTRYSRLRVIAEFRHGYLFHVPNLVSSIEFDRDDELFATAGVSKRIKVFEFSTVVNEPSDVHCPVVEMANRSKLSCLSWNKYSKNVIASSDYEGIVTVWDVQTCKSVMEYKEHEKRAWGVDFSRTEPKMLVSGSDDCKVKVWCTNQEASAINIDMKANICSVKYNPGSSFYVAVGSADHHIHYFDLRNPSAPLHVFGGHKKSVSYVKFLSNNELASASIDSTLRLWDVKDNCPLRTFSGHKNEKYFVGLSVNNEYIACGSETNEVFVYHKDFSKPASSHRFPSTGMNVADEDSGSYFISAICWKSDSPTMLTANRQGTIKVLVLAP